MPEVNLEREGRILDAAAELIIRYGYDKTSVEEIAREAGISKGAIYLHFKSKEDLFEALVLRETDTITFRFFERLDADTRGLSLFTIYLHGMLLLDESPLLKAIFSHDRRILGDWVRRLRDNPAYSDALTLTVDFVRYFQDHGLIRRDLDTNAVTYILMALRYGVLTMEDITPKDRQAPPVAQISDAMAEILSGGLAPRPEDGQVDQAAAREELRKLLDSLKRFTEQHGRNRNP